jgi:hypothetical protein
MKVEAIHSFLVHPDKASETQTAIRGTKVAGEGPLLSMLTAIFDVAPDECRHDIMFLHTGGKQQNDCRDLLIAYVTAPSKPNGLKIAQRLQSVTTHRSGLGLMFLMLGRKGTLSRIVVSRFPADHGILANEEEATLSVEFVERVFMKSATAYKSAVYEGTSIDAHFWTGRAIDKQINSDITVANYWIREFLKSDFAVTGAAGTRRFAVALRSAIGAADTMTTKQELASLAQLLPNLEGQVRSAAQLIGDFHLSPQAAKLVRDQFPNEKTYHEQFKFTAAEFVQHVAYRSVELDNRALMTAPANEFDKVFSRQELAESDQVRFSTVGRVVDERLRKSK